jgi:hypothetical protein
LGATFWIPASVTAMFTLWVMNERKKNKINSNLSSNLSSMHHHVRKMLSRPERFEQARKYIEENIKRENFKTDADYHKLRMETFWSIMRMREWVLRNFIPL